MFSTEKSVSHDRDDACIVETAHLLPPAPVPPAVRENVLRAFEQRAALQERKGVPRRLVFAAATAAALGTVALVVPPRFVAAPVSAAEVGSAVQSTRTWHLSGWRLEGTKKVPWEVWGRRYPFFYHEQIGDEVVIDDGTKRAHLLPPQRMHPRGLLLVMPSRPLRTGKTHGQAVTYDSTAFLDGTSGDYLDQFTLHERPSGALVLESEIVNTGYVDEQVRLTADRKTHLPMQYELIRSVYKNVDHRTGDSSKEKEWTKASLQAVYNVPVPREVLQSGSRLDAPLGYKVVDFRAAPHYPQGAAYGVVKQGGGYRRL